MKKNIINACFLLILVVLGLTFFNYQKKYQKESRQYKDHIEKLRSRVLLQSYYSGVFNIPKDYSIQTINGDFKLAIDVFPEVTSVLYISSNYCNTCIDDAINKIENYSKQHPKMKYVVFSKGFSLRELKLIQTERHINMPFYSLVNDDLPFFKKMGETLFPYYFAVNGDLEISNVFFPAKESSILENRYFKQLNSK